MHKKKLSVLVLLAVAALACTCNLPSLPGQGDTSVSAPQSSVILQDDFNNTASGWEVGDYDAGSVGYTQGTYFVRSETDSSTMWGVANRSFDNVVIDVDTTQVLAGPDDNNDYGVICREQGDGNGYYMLISGDGYYTILKAENRTYVNLVDWTTSNVINTGNASNQIRAVCNGAGCNPKKMAKS